MDELSSFTTIPVSQQLPKKTSYKPICGPIWMPDNDRIAMINYSKFMFFPLGPIILSNCMFYMYFYLFVRPVLPASLQITKYFLIVILFNLTLFTLLTYYCSPGVLPWYWAHEKKNHYNTKELREGYITTQEQYDYAKSHAYPPRSHVSARYGYIVLRADHYCHFVRNFIGLKNHKYFLNVLLWGLIYCISFITSVFYTFFKGIFIFPFVVFLLMAAVLIYLCYFLFTQLYTQIFQILVNTTTYERLTNRSLVYYEGDKLQGLVEIMGPINEFWQWFLPIPPNNGTGLDYPERESSFWSQAFQDAGDELLHNPKRLNGKSFFVRRSQIENSMEVT